MPEKNLFPYENPDWKGYTLDELRYQKALTTARLEIQKERMMAQFVHLRESTGLSNPKGLLGRMFSSLNYFDYGLIAYRVIKKTVGLVRNMRKK